jgi:hypothetical protein
LQERGRTSASTSSIFGRVGVIPEPDAHRAGDEYIALRPQENLKPGEEWKAPRGKKEMTRPAAAGGSEAAPAAKILPVNLLLSEIWRQRTTDSESAQNSLQ